MKFLSKLLLSSLSLLAPLGAFASECPASLGETIEAQDIVEYQSDASNQEITKGEFETTADFDKRSANLQSALAPTWLEVELSTIFVGYDADNEEFIITEEAWDQSLNWKRALEAADYSFDSRQDIGVGIKENLADRGEYAAVNGFGSSVNVSKIWITNYSILESSASDIVDQMVLPTGLPVGWRTEFQSPRFPSNNTSSSTGQVGAVKVSVPIAQAESMKDRLQSAVYFEPTARGFKGIELSEATYDDPVERTRFYNFLVGEVSCAVITDDNLKVLKVIRRK